MAFAAGEGPDTKSFVHHPDGLPHGEVYLAVIREIFTAVPALPPAARAFRVRAADSESRIDFDHVILPSVCRGRFSGLKRKEA